jgi:hypothetical protein
LLALAVLRDRKVTGDSAAALRDSGRAAVNHGPAGIQVDHQP